MKKQEFQADGDVINDQVIRVTQIKPTFVSFNYLNEGSTGLRNNGMLIEYNGSSRLKVKLGKPNGLGFLVNAPASLVIGENIGVTDKTAVDGELFTINRAGFGHIARLLSYHRDALQNTTDGGLHLESRPCEIHYSRHSQIFSNKILSPSDSIFDIEDRHGTLAFLLYYENRDLFRSFYEIFHRKNAIKIRIPEGFFDFDLELDHISMLPKRFTLYVGDYKAGDYLFSNTEEIM